MNASGHRAGRSGTFERGRVAGCPSRRVDRPPSPLREEPFVFVSLCYLVLRRALQLAALRLRSSEFKKREIIVLRHELSVLRRQVALPELRARQSDLPRWCQPSSPASELALGGGARSSSWADFSWPQIGAAGLLGRGLSRAADRMFAPRRAIPESSHAAAAPSSNSLEWRSTRVFGGQRGVDGRVRWRRGRSYAGTDRAGARRGNDLEQGGGARACQIPFGGASARRLSSSGSSTTAARQRRGSVCADC